jgi:hypothetical protein
MALGVSGKFSRFNIFDAPGVNVARRDQPGVAQFGQPGCSDWVELVEVIHG